MICALRFETVKILQLSLLYVHILFSPLPQQNGPASETTTVQSMRNNLRQLPALTFSRSLAGILRGWDLTIERNEVLHLWQSVRALFLSVSATIFWENFVINVGEAKEGLENELWRRRAHSPTFPSLYLRHSSFSNSSVASPTSQLKSSFSNLSVTSPTSKLILQPFRRFTYITAHSPTFRCFTYVTVHSPTFLSLLLRHRLFTYVTWRTAHAYLR